MDRRSNLRKHARLAILSATFFLVTTWTFMTSVYALLLAHLGWGDACNYRSTPMVCVGIGVFLYSFAIGVALRAPVLASYSFALGVYLFLLKPAIV